MSEYMRAVAQPPAPSFRIATETVANAQVMTNSDVDTQTILRVAQQLFEGIGTANRYCYMHRDINSGNVLASKEGELVWIDWDFAGVLSVALKVTPKRNYGKDWRKEIRVPPF